MGSQYLRSGGPDAVDVATYLNSFREQGVYGVRIVLTGCYDKASRPYLYVSVSQERPQALTKGANEAIGWNRHPGGTATSLEAAMYAACVRFDAALARRLEERERQTAF